MKKLFSLVAVVLFAVSANAAVLWTETLDKNGTYIDKGGNQPWGTYWPYASQWYDAGNFVQEYDSVKSYSCSIRSKRLNGESDNTIGFYFGASKAAAECYLKLFGKDELLLAGGADHVLKFEVSSPEGADENEVTMIIEVNGVALDVDAFSNPEKAVTVPVVVALPEEDIKSLHLAFDNVAQQKFITNLRIEGEGEEGVENVVLTEKAKKVMVDGVMYIVRDNKMFDVRGTQVR